MGVAARRRLPWLYTSGNCPPNGQGIAAQQMLKLLEHFDIGAMGQTRAADAMSITLVEAKKLAFEDRAKFYAATRHSMIFRSEALVSKAYNQARAQLISPNNARAQVAKRAIQISTKAIPSTLRPPMLRGNMVSLDSE